MQELIARAKRGDSEALGLCLVTCNDYLLKVANRRLPSSLAVRVGASGMVQEVFAVCCAHGKFGTFQGETEQELLAWTRRILLNLLVNEFRKRTTCKRDAHREVPLDGLDGRVCPNMGLQSPSTSPSDKAIRNERRELYLKAIEELDDPEDREIMLCRYVLDMSSFQKVAEWIGMSKSYVVKRHAACIALLGPRFARAEGLSHVGPRQS